MEDKITSTLIRAVINEKRNELSMLDNTIRMAKELQNDELVDYLSNQYDEIHQKYKDISILILDRISE